MLQNIALALLSRGYHNQAEVRSIVASIHTPKQVQLFAATDSLSLDSCQKNSLFILTIKTFCDYYREQ